ncbi:unnamed protein product [Microthlaspi erraticum]|uniref:Uncharacterized protein n=1 Tax=Microthlaspi erraticum TaxID=1685480 RepID=A0A6D2HBU6_9BRAS|nr:unnamed protein product [Microthlaspi erraticum]CAA7055168.1 unnamed protein product [Microthlaspi erraticum]
MCVTVVRRIVGWTNHIHAYVEFSKILLAEIRFFVGSSPKQDLLQKSLHIEAHSVQDLTLASSDDNNPSGSKSAQDYNGICG